MTKVERVKLCKKLLENNFYFADEKCGDNVVKYDGTAKTDLKVYSKVDCNVVHGIQSWGKIIEALEMCYYAYYNTTEHRVEIIIH